MVGKRRELMKAMIGILLSVFTLLLPSSTSQAKEWRGLTPLHSTRKDVEKLLGPPPPPPNDGTMIYTLGDARSVYFTDEDRVFISYATDEFLERVRCLGLVPTHAVAFIQVTYKVKPSLTELHIDETRFITFDPSEPPNIGFKAYVDDDDGIAICTQDGKVNDITYYATAKDRQVCQGLRYEGKDYCKILVDFIRRDERHSGIEQEQRKKSKP
jgi:hypothetical protein